MKAEECGLPDRITQVGLGLVAEALLVAIGLHALTALVLADLGLPTLLEVAHNIFWLGLSSADFLNRNSVKFVVRLGDDLVERIFNNAFRAQFF